MIRCVDKNYIQIERTYRACEAANAVFIRATKSTVPVLEVSSNTEGAAVRRISAAKYTMGVRMTKEVNEEYVTVRAGESGQKTCD